jgi:hypothetical protein
MNSALDIHFFLEFAVISTWIGYFGGLGLLLTALTLKKHLKK